MQLQSLRGRRTLEEGNETGHSGMQSGASRADANERGRSCQADKEDGKNRRPCHAVGTGAVAYCRPLPPGPARSERGRARSGRQGDASRGPGRTQALIGDLRHQQGESHGRKGQPQPSALLLRSCHTRPLRTNPAMPAPVLIVPQLAMRHPAGGRLFHGSNRKPVVASPAEFAANRAKGEHGAKLVQRMHLP